MLDSIAGSMAASDKAEEAASWIVKIRPHAGAMRNGSEPMLMLREVLELGGTCVECDVSAIPHLDVLDPVSAIWAGPSAFRPPSMKHRCAISSISWATIARSRSGGGNHAGRAPACRHAAAGTAAAATPTPRPHPHRPRPPLRPAGRRRQPKRHLPRLRPQRPPRRQRLRHLPAGAAPPAPPAPGQSIRIELSKLDKLIDAVGELVIAQAMMAQRLSNEGLAASEEIAVLDGLTRDIQESAMAIRAQPIGSVFSRVPRIMRELSASTGKHVRWKSRAKAPNSTRP
jgi:two-component system chemotaxis sensor kinase CheA